MNSAVVWGLCCLLAVAVCTNGVTSRSLIKNFTCFKDNHYVFIMARGYLNYGQVDPNVRETLLAAQAQKLLYADVYLNPCLQCKFNPEVQVDQLVEALKGTKYNVIWLMVQLVDKWPDNPPANCKYIKTLVAEALKLGKTPGIGSDAAIWEKIMGKDCVIEQDQVAVWWVKHDQEQSFEHFKPFGGFTYPGAKEYAGPKTVCGTEVDLNFCNC